MSVRGEDTPKVSSSSRGFVVAAAAVGVGFGAALYYYFNKQRQTPDNEGSTSQWETEQQITTDNTEEFYDSLDHLIITDTDLLETASERTTEEIFESDSEEATEQQNETDTEESETENINSDDILESSYEVVSIIEESENDSYHSGADLSDDSIASVNSDYREFNPYEGHVARLVEYFSYNSDSDDYESDSSMTNMEFAEYFMQNNISNSPFPASIRSAFNIFHKHSDSNEPADRNQVFRQSNQTLEECSICFDVLLDDEFKLPCSHRFHTACLLPWFQKNDTCPNCRKKYY